MGTVTGSEHRAPAVSVDEFKSALGRFATGVSVVTTVDGPDDVAMTATALVSVALDPPLVLLSVGEGSRMFDALAERDYWAASILNEDQAHVSSRFAIRGRVNDRLLFADLATHRGKITGAFVLDDALAAIECRTLNRVDVADHTLMIAEVLSVELPAPDRRPLLHYGGQYRAIRGRAEPAG